MLLFPVLLLISDSVFGLNDDDVAEPIPEFVSSLLEGVVFSLLTGFVFSLLTDSVSSKICSVP